MVASEINRTIIAVHKPSLQEKIFFLFSGILTSVPLTLFVGTFTDSLCVVLPFVYANYVHLQFLHPL